MPAAVSIFEDALAALAAGIGSIAQTGGYQTTVRSFEREYELPHQQPDDQFPFIGLAGDEWIPDPDQSQSTGKLAGLWTVTLHTFALRSGGGTMLKKLHADIVRFVGTAAFQTTVAGLKFAPVKVGRVKAATVLERGVRFAMGIVEIRFRGEHQDGDAKQ